MFKFAPKSSVARFVSASLLAVSFATVATPALAQDEEAKPFTFSGSAAIVSDYRFRGVSMSDKHMAVQAGMSVAHESGLYAGVWGSNLAGWGTFGGSNMELDIYGGYAREFGAVKVDVGLTWYMYPGGADLTDFAEPYIKVSGKAGPASMLVGVAYAPKQKALGNYLGGIGPDGYGIINPTGPKQDNLYVWTDGSFGVPGTPLTIKGHVGYSKGNPGLGPNGTSVTPTGSYWDWMIGAEVPVGPVTLGVSYIDTSITDAGSAYLGNGFRSQKDFAKSPNSTSISGATAVFSATVAF